MSTNQRTRLFVAYRDLQKAIRSEDATGVEVQSRVATLVYEVRETKKAHSMPTPAWALSTASLMAMLVPQMAKAS